MISNNRVVGLSAMLEEVNPEGVVKAVSLLVSGASHLNMRCHLAIQQNVPTLSMELEEFEQSAIGCRILAESAANLQMVGVGKAIERLQSWLDGNFPNREQLPVHVIGALAKGMEQVVAGFGDEMDGRKIFVMTPRYAHLYSSDVPLFGQKVEDKFPKAQDEIEEAGKSIALGRYTACVFHLMRAAETAVAVLGKKLKATVKNEHGETLPWGVIVSNMEPKIKALPRGAKQDSWWKIHALLHSTNRAYRTKTAHPAATYSPEQADAAFHATRSFIREFADLL